MDNYFLSEVVVLIPRLLMSTAHPSSVHCAPPPYKASYDHINATNYHVNHK